MRNYMVLISISIAALLMPKFTFAAYEVSITETWNVAWTEAEFTITNNDDTYEITNFAVANPFATGATNDNWWYSVVITRSGAGSWYTDDEDGYLIDWLNDTTNGDLLAGHTVAFYYESGDDPGVEPSETMDGFYGEAMLLMSDFAVKWDDDTVRTGETIDAIPIPSAVWLLGSGLIGLVGIRRKFRK